MKMGVAYVGGWSSTSTTVKGGLMWKWVWLTWWAHVKTGEAHVGGWSSTGTTVSRRVGS